MCAPTDRFDSRATAEPATPEALTAHRRYLFRYALSRVRDRDAAEELVQDTLLAALEGRAQFRGASALRTWLAGILNHKITDRYRREAKSPIRDLCSGGPESGGDLDDPLDAHFDSVGEWRNAPAAWPDPEQALENRRFWQVLDGCLEALPAATARAFYMREIQGLSTEEICAELAISKSNCWVMLHRARLCLRASLEARWFGSAGDAQDSPPGRRGPQRKLATYAGETGPRTALTSPA